jgi:O-antigen/teichoic acid export membrane protein
VIATFVPTLALAGALANLPLRFAGLRQTLALAKTNIDLGWSVLLANLATLLLVSIDRMWVGASFPIREFAIYSFAANALAILYNPITAISRVLFPYLADTSNSAARQRAYHTGEFGLLLAWSLGMAAFFPLRWFVAAWLPAYIGSMPILLLFLIGTAFVAPVAILHAAYMKVALRQKQFLLGASVAAAVTCGVLWFAVRAHSLEGCAVSILVGNACWWGVNQYSLRDFVNQRITNILRVVVTILVAGGAAVWLAASTHQVGSLLAYCATAALLFAILWRTELLHLRIADKLSLSFGRARS